MLFSNKVVPSKIPSPYINDIRIDQAHHHKHLRLIRTSSRSWNKHISSIITKSNRCLDVRKNINIKENV